jgi:hypothetical protein
MIKSLTLPGLEHPNLSAEVLARQARTVGDEEEKLIIAYLRNGRVDAASPGVAFDILSDEKKVIGTGDALSDGTWWWPDYLAYYVETYHFTLPEEFLAHGRAQGWKMPSRRKKTKST